MKKSQYRLSSNLCGHICYPRKEYIEKSLNTASAVTFVVILRVKPKPTTCLNTASAVTFVVVSYGKGEGKVVSQYRLSSNLCGHRKGPNLVKKNKVSIPPQQ